MCDNFVTIFAMHCHRCNHMLPMKASLMTAILWQLTIPVRVCCFYLKYLWL